MMLRLREYNRKKKKIKKHTDTIKRKTNKKHIYFRLGWEHAALNNIFVIFFFLISKKF